MSEVRSLTALRFVAALYVFAFHLQIRWPLTGHDGLSAFLSQGAVGMTVFFMLSGYILAYRYSGSDLDWKEYTVHRVARIYPIYLLAALVTIPWASLPPPDPSAHGDDILQIGRWICLVLADVTVIQSWFPALFDYWNNSASWSISNEMFFYAVFPLLMPIIAKETERNKWRWYVGAFLASVLIGCAYLLFDPKGRFSTYYALPVFRLPEFIAGIALFHLGKAVRGNPRGIEFAFLALLTPWALYLVTIGQGLHGFIPHNWINIPMVSLALLALSTPGTLVSNLMSAAPLVWLGRISYCFYSFQSFVLFLAYDHYDALVHRFPALGHWKWWAASTFLALTAVSALAYQFIEEPMRRLLTKKLLKKNLPASSMPSPIKGGGDAQQA